MTIEQALRRSRRLGIARFLVPLSCALALACVLLSQAGAPPAIFKGKYRLPVAGGFAHEWPGNWRSEQPEETRVPFGFHRGVLTIDLADHAPTPAYNGVQSTLRWNLTGQAAAIRADYGALHIKPGVDAKFRVARDHHKGFASIQVGDGLLMRHQYGDHFWERTVPYDPVAHRWLRIRHVVADDTLRWELSPDGVHWTEYARDRRRFDLTRVKTEIYGGTYQPVEKPGRVVFTGFHIARDAAPAEAVSTRAVVTDGGLVH